MTHLAYIDIDGVLADERHRQPFAVSDPPQWTEYFHDRQVIKDGLWSEGWDLYQRLMATPDTEVRYLTGRRVDLGTVTTAWLEQHGFDPTVPLTLKPFGYDGRLADFKVEVITGELDTFETVTLYDDDPAVITAVNAIDSPRAVGIFCGWHQKPAVLVKHAVA